MAGGREEKNNPNRRPQRPRVGAVYEWHPTGLDEFDSKVKRPKGSLVRVAKGSNLGASGRLPRPFTYLEDPDTGEFLGLALDSSLQMRGFTEE
jgi:hypothetical protein